MKTGVDCLNHEDERAHTHSEIVTGLDNPRVYQGYPYPRKPLPLLKHTGFYGYGSGVSESGIDKYLITGSVLLGVWAEVANAVGEPRWSINCS